MTAGAREDEPKGRGSGGDGGGYFGARGRGLLAHVVVEWRFFFGSGSKTEELSDRPFKMLLVGGKLKLTERACVLRA